MTDADVAGITAPPPSASPWANPLRARPAGNAGGEPKEKKLTWERKVVAHLTATGPTTGSALCAAFGLHPRPGIASYIAAAIKGGRIVRTGNDYSLPDQAPVVATPPPQPDPTPQPSPKPHVVRKPDFVLFIDKLQLLAWRSGAITVQTEGGSPLELGPQHVRAITLLADLAGDIPAASRAA